MAFKINNPFINNSDERSANGLNISVPAIDNIMTNFKQENDERSASINEMVETALETEANRRGSDAYKDTYNTLHHNSMSPITPVFGKSKDNKYPYLMSVYNMDKTKLMALEKPDRCSDPETDAKSGSHFCNEYWQNEYKKQRSLFNTERGLLKDMESDAKLSNRMMSEVFALDADENTFQDRAFEIAKKYRDDWKLGTKGAKVENNTKNVAWQTEQNFNTLLRIHDQAVEAQNAADRLKQNDYKFNKSLRDHEKFMDDFTNKDQRTGEYKINFGGQ